MEEEKIKNVIDKIRPYLINDGGDIEFVKYEDNIVYIKMNGACANCLMVDITINDVIEEAIREEVPDIEGVINVN